MHQQFILAGYQCLRDRRLNFLTRRREILLHLMQNVGNGAVFIDGHNVLQLERVR
jgi:hypothetical protein